MARRKTSPRRRDAVGLAGEINLGSQLLVFNNDEVVQLLKVAVEREGNQGAFARRHGLERTGLNQTLNGKRPVTGAVLKALGLRKVYAPNEPDDRVVLRSLT
jgi:DNA-binding phage protein